MTSILIDGNLIRVSVQPSQRARKTVEVKFRSKNEVVVTYPYAKDVDVAALLEKHREAIERSYRQFLGQRRIFEDKIILIKGEPHRIMVEAFTETSDQRVEMTNDTIIVYSKEQESPDIILKEWLKEHTRKLIDEIAAKNRDELGESSKIFVTDTARWGYCRKNGEIIFNWQLICLPEELAEFVVIHELVHLSVMNHQNQFHAKMLKLLPDYLQREKDLQNYVSIEPNFEFNHQEEFR